MNMNYSNMTIVEKIAYMPESILREYPFLESIEETNDYQESLSDIQNYIQESKGFPAEDFLQDIIEQVQDLMPKTGGKIDAFKRILEALDDIAQTTMYATEYSREQLNKAEAVIEALAK